MVYSKSITTPAATLETSPLRSTLKVLIGLIYRIELEFPPGCAGLLKVQIFDGLYQLFPASIGENVHSSGHLISFDDLYLVRAAPSELTIVTWNLDTAYEHEVQVRVAMASERAFQSRYMPSIEWDKFADIMTDVAVNQEALKEQQISNAANEFEVWQNANG